MTHGWGSCINAVIVLILFPGQQSSSCNSDGSPDSHSSHTHHSRWSGSPHDGKIFQAWHHHRPPVSGHQLSSRFPGSGLEKNWSWFGDRLWENQVNFVIILSRTGGSEYVFSVRLISGWVPWVEIENSWILWEYWYASDTQCDLLTGCGNRIAYWEISEGGQISRT